MGETGDYKFYVKHDDNDGFRDTIDAIYNAAKDISWQTQDGFRDVIRETAQAARDVNKEVTDQGGAAQAAISDSRAAVERASAEARQQTERVGSDVRSSVERNGGDTRQTVSDSAAETRDLISGLNARTLLSFKDQAVLDAKEHCKTREEVFENRHMLDKSHWKLSGVVSSAEASLTKQHCDIQREIVETKYELSRQADVNKCDLEAKLAKCCCELKELIREENVHTRELINENERERLQAALVSANQELLFLKSSEKGKGND